MDLESLKITLKKLVEAPGISGLEFTVREIMKDELQGVVDDIRVDKLGNLITRKGSGKEKVMLASHMDEIGLRVKSITDNGFIRFAKSGGIDDRVLLNQEVSIYGKSKNIPGVIGSKPPHLLKEEERKKIVESMDLYIDIGAKDSREVESMGVEIGDPVVFESTLTVLGKKNMIRGKALDNRAGCLALIEIMKRYEGDATIYGVGTTQEEVGVKGARTSAYGIDPDIGIALDTTTAGDTPEVKPSESTNRIGGGPVITIIEAAGRGLITSERVFRWLVKTAKSANIPYQVEVGEGGMTDASIMYITKTGIPCGAVSIPVRYIHGPAGVLDLVDVEHVIMLLTGALKKVPP